MSGEETALVEVLGSVCSGPHSRLRMEVDLCARELAWAEGGWLPEEAVSSHTALLPLPGYSNIVIMDCLRHFLRLSTL